MNKVSLSKSKYCKLTQCEKILWLSKYKPEERISKAREAIFATGTRVGEVAKGIYGEFEDVEYNPDLNIMIAKTEELLKNKPNIITEASFNYDNNFCSVDVLRNDEDGVEINEVKCSTKTKDIYLHDTAYQYYILTNLGYNVKKVNLIHINNKYIRHGDLKLDKLFSIEDVTEIAISKQEEIKENIKKINEYMEVYDANCEPEKDIGMHCLDPYVCEFWEYCTKHLPKPNVFDVFNMKKTKKFEKYYEGKISFKDLEFEKLSPKFKEQIDFELNNREPKILVENIKKIMSQLKYPLYFIDYETFQPAIPEYEGTHAYQQLPFQYSLHIIKEEGAEIEHKEFLAEVEDKDFLRHFAESMIKDIPDNGSVIIYNVSFEPARNRELANMYPDLKAELDRINSNMVDFLIPFRERSYYTKEMQGSYSIKFVLPALYPNNPELDYHNLPGVQNGGEASEAFMNLKEKSKEEQEIIRAGLLKYCELDTYAMVKVWERFKEIIR